MFNTKATILGANQLIINNDGVLTFQSYNTVICEFHTYTDELFLNEDNWDWSNTTRKYFKKFIDEYTTLTYGTKKEFLKEIENNSKIEVC
jgi:hypothetical protein